MIITFKLRTVVIVALIISVLFTSAVFVIAGSDGNNRVDTNDTIQLPIIMYHSILKDAKRSGKYVVTPDEFESDLKFLKDNGYTAVLMKDLIDYVENKTPLPKKPIVLSFDDGYYNNYLYAYPLIKKYDMKMVFSIVGTYTDQYTKVNDENAYYSHVTWAEVKEMSDSGYVEIQNHTYNMHTITNKRNGSKKNKGESDEHYKKILTEDVGKMQELIKQYTGVTPTTYTYPFGSVSVSSFEILKNMGFKATLSCQNGTNNITDDKECLYMLKRYIRPHGKCVSKILN